MIMNKIYKIVSLLNSDLEEKFEIFQYDGNSEKYISHITFYDSLQDAKDAIVKRIMTTEYMPITYTYLVDELGNFTDIG